MRSMILPMIAMFAAVPAAAQSAPDDRAALAKLIVDLTDAVTARDEAALTALTLPEGRAVSVNEANGKLSAHGWPEFIAGIRRAPADIKEVSLAPQVQVDGDIGLISAGFEFLIAGKQQYCGINHVQAVRRDGRWRVLNVTWSQRPCAK